MKIGIDIDGVILDYERVLKTYGDLYDLIGMNIICEIDMTGLMKKE